MKMTSEGLFNWASLVVLQSAMHNHLMCILNSNCTTSWWYGTTF